MAKAKYKLLTQEILQQDYDELGTINAIAIKYNIHLNTATRYMKLFNIKIDSVRKPTYTINEYIFDINESATEKGFYIAGFIAADGNISPNKKSTNIEMKIILSRKDKDHLVRIKEAMDFTGPIGESSCINKRNQKTYYSSSLSVSCSKKIIIDLAANFNIVPKKSLIYTFPNQIIDHQFVRHFIRGYFDGDGCFYIKKKQKVVDAIVFDLIGTELFLEITKFILDNMCGLKSKTKIRKTKNVYSLRYGGREDIAKIANYLYGDSTIYLQRKFDKIAHLIK